MKRIAFPVLAALALSLASPSVQACKMVERANHIEVAKTEVQPEPAKRRKIDLVLALDTSNSMDGLIDSAKARLWDVVNELSKAKPTPELRVALYTYGNDSYSAESGWVRKETGFTKDLDGLYKSLNAVRTNGGTEYVARVTLAAIEELAWDDSKDTLKILFVAGNEAASQDPKNDVQKVAKQAISKGIVVNTIYCGSAGDSLAPAWAAIAKAADGKYAVIDQEKGVKVVSAPQDKKLGELSQKLNETYIGFTPAAAGRVESQAAGDQAAAGMGSGVAASRATAKGGAMYDNSDWDLVDARKKDKKAVMNAPPAALPAPMRAMKPEEREKYVEEMAKKREAIQKEIATTSAERDAFIKTEEAKQAPGAESLDTALKASIREQAEKAGYKFE